MNKNSRYAVVFIVLFPMYIGNVLGQQLLKFIEDKKESIYYETKGKGSPVLVLAGGPGAPPNSMNEIIDYVSKTNKTLLLHQRGSGKSTNCVIDSVSMQIEQYEKDIVSVLRQENIEKTYILGHSWGAILAIDFAVKYPNKVSGLILLGSPGYSLDFLQNMNKNISQKFTKPEIDSLQMYSDKLQTEGLDESVKVKLSYKMGKLTLSKQFYNTSQVNELMNYGSLNTLVNQLTLKNLFSQKWNLKKELTILNNIPTVIIHGDSDPISIEYPTMLKEAIKDSKLVVLKNCGHYLWIEQPEELRKVIVNFLEKNK